MSDLVWTPKVVDGWAIFALDVNDCPGCSRPMVKRPTGYWGTFPKWNKNDFEAQVERGGMVIQGDGLIDDSPICTECEKAGKGSFICEMCDERRASDRLQESIGMHPPSHLCKDCYETVTAREWVKKIDELYDLHKYDHL